MSQQAHSYIFGVPIFVRDLPSGDLAVWHPFNDHVRGIVEPICRRYGYWRSEYNNWIIGRPHRVKVLNALRNAGARHG